MEINPLSLLEVTMGNEPSADDDDECMIIEDVPNPIVTLNEDPIDVDDDQVEQIVTEVEPEILAGTGVHFLQQEDPLSLPPGPGDQPNVGGAFMSESEKNLVNISSVEVAYRENFYNDLYDVLNERLHCTVCQEHVGCDIKLHPSAIEHPLLKVLVCPKCCHIYKSLKFVLGKDGKDIRCRWCGKLSGRPGGPPLRHCHLCHLGFCELCLYHNIQKLTPRHISWICVGCDPSSIWAARCTLWALQALMRLRVNTSTNPNEDLSQCAAQCRKGKQKAKTQNRGKSGKKQQFILPKQEVVKILPKQEVVQVNGTGYIPQPNMVLNGNVEKLRVVLSNRIGNQTRVVTPPPSTSSASLPPMAVFPEKMHTMDTAWLHTKLDGYEKDMMNLISKLRRIREEVPPKETIQNITTKVETVTTVLSLNSNLLKDCGMNLMHEWKEKKSRFELDNLNVSNSSQSQPTLLTQLLSVNKVTKSYSVKRKNPSTLILKRDNSTKVPCIDLELDDLLKKHNIKPCTVKLMKMSPDVINTITRRGSWNTKINVF